MGFLSFVEYYLQSIFPQNEKMTSHILQLKYSLICFLSSNVTYYKNYRFNLWFL